MLLHSILDYLKSDPSRTRVGRRQRVAPRKGPAKCRLYLEALECRALPSTLTVLNNADSGDSSLRAMLALATSGDTINFAPNLAGQTIALTSGELVIDKSLDIEGLGADQLTVSGNDASRVFDITGGGLTVTLADLAIVHGRASQGGGVDNAGSTVAVFRCLLSNNQAVGVAGHDGTGGGIFNEHGAVLTVTESTFIGNRATAGAGAFAKGGGLFNEADATLTVAASTFFDNVATGRPSTSNVFRRDAFGGGVDNEGGAKVRDTLFTDNQAVGGSGTTGQGGGGEGGAINNYLNGATVVIDQSTLTGNRAVGGSSGSSFTGYGFGGGVANLFGAHLTVSSCTLSDNQALGGTGRRNLDQLDAVAAGGGIVNVRDATAMVSQTTLQNNKAIGGAGRPGIDGARGAGGGIFSERATLTLSHCTLIGNRAIG